MAKRLLYILAIIPLLITFLPISGVYAEADEENGTDNSTYIISEIFPDEGLAQLIAVRVHNSADAVNLEVTQAKLDSITSLTQTYALPTIYSVEGIQYLRNLTELELTHNRIAQLAPLSDLTQLEILNLYQNNISDIGVLANLHNLKVLDLSLNNINDISPLATLTNLADLRLLQQDSKITDISALSDLINLTSLNLQFNAITDISSLSNLTKLDFLDLTNNQVSDINALSRLSNLWELRLTDNKINNIDSLSGHSNLSILFVNNNHIADITPLDSIHYLTLEATGQEVILPAAKVTSYDYRLDSPIKSLTSEPVRYHSISNSGTNIGSEIVWEDLSEKPEILHFKFTTNHGFQSFSGTVTQPVTYEIPAVAPTITVSDKQIEVGDTFDPLEGVTAVDENNNDLSDQLTVESNTVNTSTAGTYEVTYSVVDARGLTSTATITVTVVEKEETEAPLPESPETPQPEEPETAQPGETETPANPNESDDGSDNATNDEEVISVSTESNDKNGYRLPNTATNTFSLMLLGGILLIAGGSIAFFRKKKLV